MSLLCYFLFSSFTSPFFSTFLSLTFWLHSILPYMPRQIEPFSKHCTLRSMILRKTLPFVDLSLLFSISFIWWRTLCCASGLSADRLTSLMFESNDLVRSTHSGRFLLLVYFQVFRRNHNGYRLLSTTSGFLSAIILITSCLLPYLYPLSFSLSLVLTFLLALLFPCAAITIHTGEHINTSVLDRSSTL